MVAGRVSRVLTHTYRYVHRELTHGHGSFSSQLLIRWSVSAVQNILSKRRYEPSTQARIYEVRLVAASL